IANVLKKDDDAKNYSRLSEEIKAAFNQKFLTSNGYDVIKMSPIDQGTGQTSNVLPLFYDMVPQDRKQEIIQKLLNLITNDQDFHLDTGIIGTKYIFDVLAENGYAEIAYKIVTQESYPSFGYMIKEGATTLWERWEKLMGGGMNSHNHVMFGSVDAWFYKYLAGLSPIVAGWKKFKVKPYIVGDLKYVSSSIATVRGKIKVSWERSDNAFKLNLSVPNECQAELHLPVLWEKYSISENGKEMKFAEQRKARVVFDVNSGNYEFTIKMN
ncbi:MAG: alpha-L-rhamnosidase, partial [Candidatus Parvarchaeota archaeon]|nr:alpha-L-rhamnosidase [Candidatus Jingweiarchaeum tengchongense]